MRSSSSEPWWLLAFAGWHDVRNRAPVPNPDGTRWRLQERDIGSAIRFLIFVVGGYASIAIFVSLRNFDAAAAIGIAVMCVCIPSAIVRWPRITYRRKPLEKA